MITRAQRIKLIVFLVGTLSVGLAMFVLFVDQRLFRSTDTYYVRVPGSVNGIENGATVAVRGVRVGEVDEILLHADDLESVRLKLAVERGTVITQSAVATLALQGLTGQKFVDIVGGADKPARLPPGSQIPYQPSMLDRVTDHAGELLAQTSDLLSTTNALVKRLGEVASQLDDERVRSLLTSTQQTIQHFDAAGAELTSLLRDTKQPIQRTLSSADIAFRGAAGVTQDASKLMNNVNEMVLQLNGVIRQNEDQLRVITYNLREATQNFKFLGQELRQRPSRLLIGDSPPERKLP
jgi:phospholipid/cholesterol/gamma-HCH transport system substrate-binding protein